MSREKKQKGYYRFLAVPPSKSIYSPVKTHHAGKRSKKNLLPERRCQSENDVFHTSQPVVELQPTISPMPFIKKETNAEKADPTLKKASLQLINASALKLTRDNLALQNSMLINGQQLIQLISAPHSSEAFKNPKPNLVQQQRYSPQDVDFDGRNETKKQSIEKRGKNDQACQSSDKATQCVNCFTGAMVRKSPAIINSITTKTNKRKQQDILKYLLVESLSTSNKEEKQLLSTIKTCPYENESRTRQFDSKTVTYNENKTVEEEEDIATPVLKVVFTKRNENNYRNNESSLSSFNFVASVIQKLNKDSLDNDFHLKHREKT